MITLISAQPNLHCFFERQRGQIVFRWVIYTEGEARFRSDWQSVSDMKGADAHLFREFTSRFDAWAKAREQHLASVNAYFEAYTLAGRDFDAPKQWVDVHRAFVPFLSAKEALTDQLVLKHPSADFCTVQPDDANNVTVYFALCHRRVWSSTQWLAPSVWADHADEIFPSPSQDGNGGRSLPAEVRREVWRRDNGQCVRCGSRERLEFDHIVPFSKGGSSTVRNVELLCEACNRQKGSCV